MNFTVPIWLLVTLGIGALSIIALAVVACYRLAQIHHDLGARRW